MNLRSIAFGSSLLVAAPAMASVCTGTFNLGTVAPASVVGFGNSFDNANAFTDCYDFKLITSAANAIGITLTWDWSSRLNLDLTSVSLSGGGLAGTVTDTSPTTFSFSGLAAGDYVLAVSGNVVANQSAYSYLDLVNEVGYAGLLATTGSSVVTPVPEPESLAMFVAGAALFGWRLRSKR